MGPHLGGSCRCVQGEATERGRTTAIVFGLGLQLFVPFAQKDAKLA